MVEPTEEEVKERLRITLEYIEGLPERNIGEPLSGDSWAQWTWGLATDCGTAACYAGWYCVLFNDPEKYQLHTPDGAILTDQFFDEVEDILGWDGGDMLSVTYSGNSIETIKRNLERLGVL